MDLKGYQQYKEQSIATMTQEELLLLLYDELVKRLMQAELALDKKEYPLFEASVQRGIEIIDYLDSTLDRKYEISTIWGGCMNISIMSWDAQKSAGGRSR